MGHVLSSGEKTLSETGASLGGGRIGQLDARIRIVVTADAALGTTIEIPTIDGGKAKIKIPDGTQSGKQFRLKGKGMPYMRGSGTGDLYVQINTEVPISLNKEQKELLEKFREIENEKSNPSIKQFFKKAKSFWKN